MELRISQLESKRVLTVQDESTEEIEKELQFKTVAVGSILESKVGEFGLSWLGNIVLFFGIIFLVQYIQNSGYQIASSVFGYVSVVGIFVLAHFMKSTYSKMASIFNLNAYLILFYVTLKLHFFTSTPILDNNLIAIFLITLMAMIQLVISVKKKSEFLVGVALVLLSIVAIVSNTTHFMLIMAVVIASLAVYSFYSLRWTGLVFLSILLVYLINLFWFFNNPIMGNELQAITIHNFGFIYIFIIGAIYSLITLINKNESLSTSWIIWSIVLNGLGFSSLLLLYSFSFFKDDYILMTGSISFFCLIYSVLLQLKSERKIAAALYALYGFVMMSIMFHGLYEFPNAYFLLAIQSLLVVSMAIWFRSKFIVVMNLLLYLTLLIFYISTSSLIDWVNISFTLVALITARILNWRRDMLTIKTDILRNVYLIAGFIMVLVTLNYLIPARYITLSWTVAAVTYFVLSVVLKNVKYRYMALGTMIAATFYLFIVDLAKIELVFRIIALMFLAIISIGLSIYYSKRSKRKVDKED